MDAEYKPEFDSLRDRLIDLAQVRHVQELVEKVVCLLSQRPHVALARIWLLRAGDQCASCAMAMGCEQRKECLHLVASAGAPAQKGFENWNSIGDRYARIPLGSGKVGRVAATGEAIVVEDFVADPVFLGRYEWAARQNIRGFNAQPIRFKENVLGVLAIFTVIPTPSEGPVWLRILADQIAGALMNARAFEEIEALRARLELENSYLQEEVQRTSDLGQIIGESAAIRELLRQIQMVAPTDASVLILGESGTGKELVARELHRRSQRAERPLIRVNCASVPRELYESEFFGHVKGAFTGAIKDRAGRFQAADGGTLFLDEVGEIPMELQSKFLRVLQEKQYERVGEEKTRTVDVRIIAASNRDLEREVQWGRFREDLFYRLNVFPLRVPSLRERREDIPLLAKYLLEQASRRMRLPLPPLTPDEAAQLQACDWPGNVRELQNALERALILARDGRLRLPPELTVNGSAGVPSASEEHVVGDPLANRAPCSERILTETELQELERRNLLAALEQTNWKIHGPGGAAELLGVKPTTLSSRIKKWRLKPAGAGQTMLRRASNVVCQFPPIHTRSGG